MIPLFDLHCDTFLELFYNKKSILKNNLHISYNKLTSFSPYIQVGAIWCNNKLSNEEAYIEYKQVVEYIKESNIPLSASPRRLRPTSFILAVEDARLLNNDISKLSTLYNDGVRFITLNWKGESCIGGGWDTSQPLTAFGIQVVEECAHLGITVDLSHSSYITQLQVIELAKQHSFIPICSHSNSFTVCNYDRNLHDDVFKELVKLRGVIGLSLVTSQIKRTCSDIMDIVPHIEHYLKLDGENAIALGCDFDGTSSLPNGISSIKDLDRLYSIISKYFTEQIAKKIFFYNAYNFFVRNHL